MADPLATVLIPAKNGGARFWQCLEAVKAQELPGGFEILVVDSGSSDGSDKLAEQYGRLVRIKPEEFNHGLTRNLGMSESRGKYVALLVQDAVPEEGWLDALVKAVEPEGVAGAYSRQVPRPACPPFIKARLDRWSAGMTEREIKSVSGEEELMSLPFIERVRLLSFDNVSSCIKKEVWEKVPFRQRRFGEDAAWARDVLLSGYKTVFEPASVVEHSHHNSMWYEFKRVYLDHRNWREVAEGALFNNLFEVFLASVNGVSERWQELDELQVKGASKLYWMAYALPWSFSQNIAQYLGARSYKAAIKIRWYNKVDEFMSRGV